MSDTVSCTVDEVYSEYGIPILHRRELRFNDFNLP